jgi:predicted nucleic acid-binding protein
MTSPPSRLFLDTNVYLIGESNPDSQEAQILEWIGYREGKPSTLEVVVSDELFRQISRVSRRLRGKDWGGEILARIWQNLRLRYVLLDEGDFPELEESGMIPREDIGVYLTARDGGAQCFISSNHELIAMLAEKTGDFECLTPSGFVEKYLKRS